MEQIISPAEALPGRREALAIGQQHAVNGHPTQGPWPEGMELAWFGMGCFWGVERLFWQQDGVWLTEVGFAGGTVPNPTYKQVCAGGTGQAEVVRLIYDSSRVSYERLLQVFFKIML